MESEFLNEKDYREYLINTTEAHDFSLADDNNNYVYASYFDDRQVMMSVVKNNPHNLMHASERLKNDKEVVLEAVKIDHSAIAYASDSINSLVGSDNVVEDLNRAINSEKLFSKMTKQMSASSTAKREPKMKI